MAPFSVGDGLSFIAWEQSGHIRDLYGRRCLKTAEELTAHAQAVELLATRISSGDTVLDAGCGSGYFFHSIKSRGLPVSYWGVDCSETLLAIGRATLPQFGLSPDRLVTGRIENLQGQVDHIVCINVLTNIDNFHRPLERMLQLARKSLILRESMRPGHQSAYHYVHDKYLDAGVKLNVHVNHYGTDVVCEFVRAHGFEPTLVVDRRTGGEPETVIDHPHYWTFLAADRLATKDTA